MSNCELQLYCIQNILLSSTPYKIYSNISALTVASYVCLSRLTIRVRDLGTGGCVWPTQKVGLLWEDSTLTEILNALLNTRTHEYTHLFMQHNNKVLCRILIFKHYEQTSKISRINVLWVTIITMHILTSFKTLKSCYWLRWVIS